MERNVKVLIVDDDPGARKILKKYLEIADNVEFLGSVSDTFLAMNLVEKNIPDLIFLDINMPNENGLQFAEKLRHMHIDSFIVFTTAYKHYAVNAIHFKPLDYLVKPFSLEDVFDILTKTEELIAEKQKEIDRGKIWGNIIPNKLKFRTIKGYVFVNPNDIVFAKVIGPVVEIFMNDGSKERLLTIFSNLLNEIEKYGFARVNRSLIVNIKYLKYVDKKTKKCMLCTPDNEYMFSVSQVFITQFDKKYSMRIG
jgi:DNA-binding LytR/AlgR family response regulator